jgi:hypothetical protein
LVFFDDILIYIKTEEKHIKHLGIILKVLQDNRLFAKHSKCVFVQSQVEYLCHIISGDGVATDPEKIVAVKEWPEPKSITELRGFLGLARYYRRFIRDYGKICIPLFDSLKKGNFNGLKQNKLHFK